jgi:deazaflavin-dependent oxidoreductase (nitroreductase family)
MLVEELSRPRRAGALLGLALEAPWFGRLLSRILRAPAGTPGATSRVTRLHARLLRLSGGRLRRSWLFAAGQPVIALSTVGRRSGTVRTTTVTALVHEGDLATVGMNLGASRDPAWALNLLAHPEAEIEVRGRRFPVSARLASGAQRDALWARWLELQPSAQTLARQTGREVPIFVLEPRPLDNGPPCPAPTGAD